jgi:hypothetical protein
MLMTRGVIPDPAAAVIGNAPPTQTRKLALQLVESGDCRWMLAVHGCSAQVPAVLRVARQQQLAG